MLYPQRLRHSAFPLRFKFVRNDAVKGSSRALSCRRRAYTVFGSRGDGRKTRGETKILPNENRTQNSSGAVSVFTENFGSRQNSTCTLTSLINNRLSPSDRPRLRTYCYQLIAATTALGVARVIRACLPLRCGSSNRALPTPGDAIPSNGIPPRPPTR